MKTLSGNGKVSGLTLIELLVVIAVIAVLAAMLLPVLSNRDRRSPSIYCLNNQKQIAIGVALFQSDYNGKLPWQVPAFEGGSMEFESTNSVAPHFQTFSNYISKQTRLLVCPLDTSRRAAANFATLTNTNISYFLNLDVVNNVNSILSGDRLLDSNGLLIRPGVYIQTTNVALVWAAGAHKNLNKPRGIFSFGDGHAQAIVAGQLNDVLQKQPLATNRFCFP